MKINDLIKMLNDLKKQHGNLPVNLINGDTGYPNGIQNAIPLYPLDGMMCSDRTKPSYGIALVTWK
jgi:hypothetical protein